MDNLNKDSVNVHVSMSDQTPRGSYVPPPCEVGELARTHIPIYENFLEPPPRMGGMRGQTLSAFSKTIRMVLSAGPSPRSV